MAENINQVLNLIIMLKRIDSGICIKGNSILKKWGITHSQFKILIYLLNNEGKILSQRDLETHFNMTNPTITGILNRLEQNGFVMREISGEDARIRRVVITEKTKSMENQLFDVVGELGDVLLQGITLEELGQMQSVLGKIQDNLTV